MTARLHRLANGLTVAVEPMAHVETAAVGLYADIGSRSEPAGLAGLAHMVEHMVFKGAGTRDARALAEAIEDVGGQLNAWTARDQTVFHARILPGDLSLAVDLVADLVRAPHLDAAELEREKQVVLAELGEARDTPDDIVFDHLAAASYPGQPYGEPVLGTERSIAAIDVTALSGWLERQYRPAGLVLAAAGALDEDALLRLAEARFGDLAAGAPPPAPAAFASGTAVDARRFDQVHIAFAHPGVGHLHPDLHALSLFAGIAGGGMSSRLFQEVREARGLAYSVYAWSQAAADTGQLGVYLAAAKGDAPRAYALARDVLARAADTLDEAELARAKAQARAGLLMMGLEGVQARCDHLARSVQIHGRVVPAAETIAEIDAVTVAHARRVGAEAIAGGLATASVGGRLAKAA